MNDQKGLEQGISKSRQRSQSAKHVLGDYLATPGGSRGFKAPWRFNSSCMDFWKFTGYGVGIEVSHTKLVDALLQYEYWISCKDGKSSDAEPSS